MIHHVCAVCGAEIESPDSLAGGRRQCPDCASRIKVPDETGPAGPDGGSGADLQMLLHAAEDEAEEHARAADIQVAQADRLARARGALFGWGTVRTALAQLVAGAGLLAFGLGALLVLDLAQAGGFTGRPGNHRDMLDQAALLLAALVAVGSTAPLLTGICTCCGAPNSSGARGWIIASLVFLFAAFLLAILLTVALQENARIQREAMFRDLNQRRFDPFDDRGGDRPAPRRPPIEEGGLKGIAYAVQGAVGVFAICFLLFLRRTALAAGQNSQHIHALIYLAVVASLWIGTFLLTLNVGRGPGLMPAGVARATDPVVGRVVLAGMVVLAAWFGLLAGLVRWNVTEMMLRRQGLGEPVRSIRLE